jgi:3-ketosteroid 9alpha-monooxygenase subunit B
MNENYCRFVTRDNSMPARLNVRAGRVGIDLLRELTPPSLGCHFFICGPAVSVYDRASAREKGVTPQPRFMESVLADLKTLGVPSDQITRESYG